MRGFKPTSEQINIIGHDGSAFISACPGAGKTRCLVESARVVFEKKHRNGAVGFLSFTNAAIEELEERLILTRALPDPLFPNFIGTFDSFVWQFLVAPFGFDGGTKQLCLITDKKDMVVKPLYNKAQPLPLDCFDRQSGRIISAKTDRLRFGGNPTLYESLARNLRSKLLKRGLVDFEDVREIARVNLGDEMFSERLASVLSARFAEIFVDEAQDCNPDDLGIIDWLRFEAKIPTKVICDPHQSIYGFRGGVTDDLFKFAKTFKNQDQLPLSGNFRSTRHICRAIHVLRAPDYRGCEDEAVGELKDKDTPVYVTSYKGAVCADIGRRFLEIVAKEGIEVSKCRLTAKTRESGSKSIGAFRKPLGDSLPRRIADAAMRYHQAASPKEIDAALSEAHKITLTLSNQLNGRTYHQTIVQDEIKPLSWRGDMVRLLQFLKFDPTKGHTRPDWVSRARKALVPYLCDGQGTIAQKIPNAKTLDELLFSSPILGVSQRTIHEVKGKEYPGICLVMTTSTAKGILDHLEGKSSESAEAAREIYVAASRAQQLLVIACPQSQADRLADHLSASGAKVNLQKLFE